MKSAASSSHQQQFQRSQQLKYFQRNRPLDQDQSKIKGLTRDTAIQQFLIHKQLMSQVPATSEDQKELADQCQDHFKKISKSSVQVMDEKLNDDSEDREEINEADFVNTDENTGTIQNDDQELKQASKDMIVFWNQYSMHECEPAPVSNVSNMNENTATFRGKENSRLNVYDMLDADLNSINYHHPSKESLQTKHQFVQSVESFQNQNFNVYQQPSQHLKDGQINSPDYSSNQFQNRQTHLDSKQRQISLQNTFDKGPKLPQQIQILSQSQPLNGSFVQKNIRRDLNNCANFQNFNQMNAKDPSFHQSSVFTEQADVISPDELDEFVPINHEDQFGLIMQSTPVLENFSNSSPGAIHVSYLEPVKGQPSHDCFKESFIAKSMTDNSQNANITDLEEEQHIHQQMIQDPVLGNHLQLQKQGESSSFNDRKAQLNSHLSAFCQMQLSTREKQKAWQNLQIEGMAFSQPDDEHRSILQNAQIGGNKERSQHMQQKMKQQRENLLINHMLSDYDKKASIISQPEKAFHERPSHISGPSFTQFDALTPISLQPTDPFNFNSQRPLSSTTTNKILLHEVQQLNQDQMDERKGKTNANLQMSNNSQINESLKVPNIQQLHELQASPHNRETDRLTAKISSRQQQQIIRQSAPMTNLQTVDTNKATTDSKSKIDQELDQSQTTLSQQNILKNIFFSKDSLQKPAIIKQKDGICISHNQIQFKSILSSFVDEKNQDNNAQLLNDLRNINLNLVQVTDTYQNKSKYLMQLTICDAKVNSDGIDISHGQIKQNAQIENMDLIYQQSQSQNKQELCEQLDKLEPNPNFEKAYNQVNELMINNLIDDQQLEIQRQNDNRDHKHYLLLGGGECFGKNQDIQSLRNKNLVDRGVDAKDIDIHDLSNLNTHIQQNQVEIKRGQRIDKMGQQRVNRVSSALKVSDESQFSDQNLSVFQRLSRPKSSQLQETKQILAKQYGQSICKKGFGKTDPNNTQQVQVKSGSNNARPSTQLIKDLYYDYFAKNQKKQKEQQDSQENRQKILIQKSQENLNKQNMVLAQRITGRVQKAFTKIFGAQRIDADIIDFNSFLNILQDLYYIDQGRKDEYLLNLAREMWRKISRAKFNKQQLSHGSELSLISKVNSSVESSTDQKHVSSLIDLQTFILAVENVHFLRPQSSEKTPLNLNKWQLEKYGIYEPNQVKKTSNQFRSMVQHRQRRLNQIVQEKELQQFKNVNRFEPIINRKSELIVNMKTDRNELSHRGISARNSQSRVQSRERTQSGDMAATTFRSQRTFSGTRATMPQTQNNNIFSRSKRGHFSKIQGQRQIIDDQKAKQLNLKNCGNLANIPYQGLNPRSVSPNNLHLNFHRIQQRPREDNNQNQESIRPQNIKRTRSFETNQRSSINRGDSAPGTRRSQHSNVFFNLFKIAKERQEKSADSHRQALENLAKKEAEECTFKPDFSKTQLKTKKYLSRRGVSSKIEQKTIEQSNSSNPITKRSLNVKINRNQRAGMYSSKLESSNIVILNLNDVLGQKKKSKQPQTSKSQTQARKKKKSKNRNNKLLKFTTQVEKENLNSNLITEGPFNENIHSHLRSFVSDLNEDQFDRTQLVGSRLNTQKLNLSDLNCFNTSENHEKTINSAQNHRANRNTQKKYEQTDESFTKQKETEQIIKVVVEKDKLRQKQINSCSHQKMSSLTQSIQFHNLDEIIATDGLDDVCDLAEQTGPAQIEQNLKVTPDMTSNLDTMPANLNISKGNSLSISQDVLQQNFE